MGIYLNPGNSGFARIVRGTYVDKTGLIGLLNTAMDTPRNLTCVCRPRRFGKSYAAQMLCAYYDKTSDSRALFHGCRIEKDPSYEKYLNQLDVIYLDMTSVLEETLLEDLSSFIRKCIQEDIKRAYPEVVIGETLTSTLVNLVSYTGNKIFMIIDEWDAPIRESARKPDIQENYLRFLRMLFKNSGTTAKIFAGAYMTGILPIKKDGTQSAVSDFKEYTILEPLGFAEYAGFTEDEVRELCIREGRSFAAIKKWYDGYTAGSQNDIYNPYSVMNALESGLYRSYWQKTSAAETLMTYIDMDLDGLQADIARLIAGENIPVCTDLFQNDVETFSGKDDVLTLLIHLGYLTYETLADTYDWEAGDPLTYYVRIPNEEVRTEFNKILHIAKHRDLISLVKRSDKLIDDTIAGNEEAVALAFEQLRNTEYAPTFYNDEQSLRYLIKIAYISAVDQYARIEELPSGRGLADVVFLPKRRSALPAMLIELKWNKTAEGAIGQILERNYPAVLSGYGGEIILVGVNYDEKTKKHTCRIRRISSSESFPTA